MDHRQAGRYWESNALAWTRLSRQGWNVYRDAINTQAFVRLAAEQGQGIRYAVASTLELPFAAAQFDFVAGSTAGCSRSRRDK